MPASRGSDIILRLPKFQEPKQPNTRVVASKDQLLILNSFRDRIGSRSALKAELEDVSRQTGLTPTWIRKWLARKNNPRSRSKAASSWYCQEQQPTPVPIAKSATPNAQAIQALNLHSPVPLRSIRPDILRTTSAPEASTMPSALSSSGSPSDYLSVYDCNIKSRSVPLTPAMDCGDLMYPISASASPDNLVGHSPITALQENTLPPLDLNEPRKTPDIQMQMSASTESVLALIRALEAAAATGHTTNGTTQDKPQTLAPSVSTQTQQARPDQPVASIAPVPTVAPVIMQAPMHHLYYPSPPISFKMRYADVIAMHGKVLQEYRKSEAMQDIKPGKGAESPDCSLSDKSSESSIDGPATPTDSPMLEACESSVAIREDVI